VLAGLDPTQALTRYFLEVGVVFLQPAQMLANAAIPLLESKSVRFRTRLLKLQVAQVKHAAASKNRERGTDREQDEGADDDAFVFPRKCR
jgi:hypothetical protein